MALKALLCASFVAALSLTTYVRYQGTYEHPLVEPQNIISGQSQAPHQYRVLPALLFSAIDRVVGHTRLSDKIVQAASILFCYGTALLLFFRASRSLPLAMLALLALFGSFSSGMQWKHRTEFFETGLVALLMHLTHAAKVRWPQLGAVTLLGSLNRETFLLALVGTAAEVLRPPGRRAMLLRIATLFVIGGAALVTVRIYYGFSAYHVDFWRYADNLRSFGSLYGNMFGIGAGLLLVYAFTVAQGNREYLPFTVGYAATFLVASFLASNWLEQRIFFPLYPVCLASVLKFAANPTPCLDPSPSPPLELTR